MNLKIFRGVLSKSVDFKVGLFLMISLLLIFSFIIFLLFKKDFFTAHIYYTLSSRSGEGISEGTPLLFSGFEIGRVANLRLNEEGSVIITVKVPERHASRINKSSKFTLEKPIVGAPRFVVETPDLSAAKTGENDFFFTDTTDDVDGIIKKLQPMIEKIDGIASNIKQLTDQRGDLTKSLANLQKITQNFAQKQTLIEMLSGDKISAKNFKNAVASLSSAMQEAETTVASLNRSLTKADEQILGQSGTVTKINEIVVDINEKMGDIGSLIDNLAKSGENLKTGTQDLDILRQNVDIIVNSLNLMIQDVRNALPIEQKREIILP